MDVSRTVLAFDEEFLWRKLILEVYIHHEGDFFSSVSHECIYLCVLRVSELYGCMYVLCKMSIATSSDTYQSVGKDWDKQ